MLKRWLGFGCLFFHAFFFGCDAKESSTHSSQTLSASDKPTKDWVVRAVKTLRYKDRIQGKEELDQFLAMGSKDEVLDALMKEDAFHWTVLDFNFYFLGDKQERLESYDGGIVSSYFPQATSAAYQFAIGGDYNQFFDYQVNLISPPRLLAPYDSDWEHFVHLTGKGFKEDPNTKDSLYKAKFWDQVLAAAEKDVKAVLATKNLTQKLVCQKLRPYLDVRLEGYFHVFSNILPAPYSNLLSLPPVCSEGEGGWLEVTKSFLAGIQYIRTGFTGQLIKNPSLIREASYHERLALADFYQLPKVPDWDGPIGFTGISDKGMAQKFWEEYPNSSTNFNRKRAAKILDTFFCDDLTPVNIDIPESHSNEAHASDPACQSCHYKLDPMAGLFRLHGFIGIDDFESIKEFSPETYSGEIFIFDDQVVLQGKERSEYLNYWNNHGIKTGFIQSAKDSSDQNLYGENIKDLFKIIKESRRVKQCLVKRMASYFIGEGQMFERKWLEGLTDQYMKAKDGTEGFKIVTKELLKSNSFTMGNPEAKECYDFADGSGRNADNSPPCEVAALLERYCQDCHGAESYTGLNLTSWQKAADGFYGFSSTKKERCEIHREINRRLNPSAKGLETPGFLRMPLGGGFDDDLDQTTLVLWNQNRMNETCLGGQQ